MHFISMEEGNSDKNTEIDWKNTFEDQMREGAPRNNQDPQNIERKENFPLIQKNQRIGTPPRKP